MIKDRCKLRLFYQDQIQLIHLEPKQPSILVYKYVLPTVIRTTLLFVLEIDFDNFEISFDNFTSCKIRI